jgi:hypothetical protein
VLEREVLSSTLQFLSLLHVNSVKQLENLRKKLLTVINNHMSNQSDFEKWQRQWDAAAAQFAKESAEQMAAIKPQPPTSFFNDAPMDRDYKERPVDDELSWHDIYARSQEIESLITDSVKWDDGEPEPKQNFGAFTPTRTNPNTQSATGPDMLDPKTGNVRVTPNWVGGEDLNELDRIGREIEQLERKYHRAEVAGEKASSFKTELKSLRDRVRELSEKINRGPKVDVT